MAKTLQQLAEDALLVQNACNPLGITKSLAADLQDLWNIRREADPDYGTKELCKDPIFRLWASKVHDLAGMGLSDLCRFGDAMSECEQLAAEDPKANTLSGLLRLPRTS